MNTRSSHDSADDDLLTDVAAAVIDDRGTVEQWSRAASKLLGLSATEVCGKPVGQLFADEGEWDGLSSPDGSAGGRTSHLRHADGHRVAVRCRVLPLERASCRLLLAVPADRAEDAEQGASLLRALLAQDRFWIVLRDSDTYVVRTNRTLDNGLLMPPGTRLADVMEGPDATTAETRLKEVLRTGVPQVNVEQHVRSLAEPAREWSLSVTAVRTTDRAGRPSGVAVLLTDATEQWLAARRLRLRHRAAVGIGGSLDVRQTAEEITDVLVPDFAGYLAVDLAEAVLVGDDPPRAFSGAELRLCRMAARAVGGLPPGALQPGQALQSPPGRLERDSFEEGRTIIVDRATVEARMTDAPAPGLVIPKGGRTMALAPLCARGRVLGCMTAWRTDHEEPYTPQDVDLLTEIAAHAAISIDNARRYVREHRAAVALQQRLLPASSTRTAAVVTEGRYRPPAGGAEIGGDWFDAIPLPSLRVAMIVGDVVGHGLHAAATMGRLRTAVQTLADLELPPDELLTRLDELVARLAAEASPTERDVVGATCLVALYDPVSRQCTFASAGHLPPIVAGPDGTATIVPVRPGPPLGVGGLPFETTTIDLTAGQWLAVYTDGLLGRPADDIDAAVRRLAERIGGLRRSGCPLEAASKILTGVPAADDTALLLARIDALPADAAAQWEFPADPATVSDARAAVAGTLERWGLAHLDFTVELIVSELVTNAIRYAGGPVGVRLLRDGVLVCEVSDPSNTQPRLRRAALSDEGNRGLFLVAQTSDRWGSRFGQSGKTIWAELALQKAEDG
ncbi:SpoIIE family protein phosphatase [Streptomyces longwoodensis]|uniref:ATP-binding SpoIIE family protein phosphatase n=1 Tax=Streptomyces longwoodensis TaxID=68231 RepID=UPI0033F61323